MNNKISFKQKIKARILGAWRCFAARPNMAKLNDLLLDCALRGLGVLNFESSKVSGEIFLMEATLPRIFSGKLDVTCIDIGANEGTYSLNLRRYFPSAKILSVEPHPETFQRLKKNGGDNFKYLNCAIGAENGEVVLYDRKDSATGSEHASLYRSVITDLHEQHVVEFRVPILSLSELLKNQNITSVDLLKVDTEGHELAVLQGASEWLQNGGIRVIHIEFNEMNVISRTFFRDIRGLLEKYECYRLLPRGMIKVGLSPIKTELFAFQNLLFIYEGN